MRGGDFDAIVVGGGHNGLVAAAYLGKFGGLRVLVLEGRDILGGFATSERPFKGHPAVIVSRFGVDHMHMCSGPVPRELGLENYKPREAPPFKYLWHDQAHWLYMYPGGRAILAAKSLDETAARVERTFPGEGEPYRRFAEQWFRILDVIGFLEEGPPIGNGLAGFGASLAGADALVQFMLGNPMDFICRYFKTDELRGMMAWWACQTASPPWQPGSSVLASSLAPATHLTGKARPQGGTGALAAVLRDMIVHEYGGQVLTGCVVQKVQVARGEARGVEWEERATGRKDSAAAPLVLSAADARTLFTKLVPPEEVPARLMAEVRRIYYSPVGLCKADVLVNSDTDFAAAFGKSPTGNDRDLSVATGIIAPGYDSYVRPGWVDILAGRPARLPALWCVQGTALDPTLAPPGYHTLWLSQFAPKTLADGKHWNEVKEEVGLAMFRTYAQYAGLRESDIVDIVVTTPEDMSQLVCSVDPFGVGMNIDQMLSYRPSPSLSRYRTPIRGLYLTGSGTHPGGGITGVPGRNAALEALADLGRARGSPRRGPCRLAKQCLQTYRKLRKLEID